MYCKRERLKAIFITYITLVFISFLSHKETGEQLSSYLHAYNAVYELNESLLLNPSKWMADHLSALECIPKVTILDWYVVVPLPFLTSLYKPSPNLLPFLISQV